MFDSPILLEDRKGLSSTQIFAHVASEAQVQIKPGYQSKGTRKNRRQSTVSGHLEVRRQQAHYMRGSCLFL